MTMTQTHTRTIESRSTPLEALFPRETFVDQKPVFLGHPDARCDICEAPFSNERCHPQSDQYEGLITICGDHLMRLTTAISG